MRNTGRLILALVLLAGSATARDARAVLEEHCVRCHGRDGAAVKGVFVLDRDRLVASGVVVPGDAGSRLLRAVESDAMPLGGPPLSDDEKRALREWVLAGAPAWDAAPPPRRAFVSDADLRRAIVRDLDAAPARSRSSLRYVSFAHLANAGASETDLARYRAALSKLVNSLSWRREIAVPRAVDETGVLLRVDLRDYGWTADAWRRVELSYPYGLETDATITRVCGATVPYVRADWFVAAASVPPLYHDMLELPQTVAELERLLGVDTGRGLREEHGVLRAGVRQSGVSQNSRIVERHETGYGAYWRSYDFRNGSRDVFADPVRISADGGEMIFTLPNGMQGYFLADARGRRIDAGPLDIVSDRTRPDDPTVRNGRSCMSCHTEGVKSVTDDVRPIVTATFGRFDREKALALYAPQEALDGALAEDRDRFLGALDRAGARSGAAVDAEPVGALARRYQSDLEVDAAAAELGLSIPELSERMWRFSAPVGLGLEPLLVPGGGIKRAVWEQRFAAVVRQFGLGTPAAVPQPRPAGSRVFVSTKTRFFTPSQLENELRKLPAFASSGIAIVRDRAAADMEIVVDRPLFTYTYTYAVTDLRTSEVVASGKLTAFDGNFAAPKIAAAFLEQITHR